MNEVDQIKDSIDIVEFVRQYVELHRAGANWRGLCPFHNEKTPSFMVSSDKQIFKCFGCSEGGDIFEFLMKVENLSFPEALQILADRAGVQLSKNRKPPKEYAREKDTKTAIFKINSLSAKVFNKILKDHESALLANKYLKSRKINNDAISKFMIGYAPSSRVLLGFFKKRGFNDTQIREAGNPDKFYKRIMFPIQDRLGNVVAFTGRTIEKNIEPKYLNTPETIIFHKSKTLYGLNFSRDSIRKEKHLILVEGQMDVVLSHIAGVENVVATSGTALTEDHLKILSRYNVDISFCFDGDDAGKIAAKKAIKMAYNIDISPYIIEIPNGYKDVGDIVEKDPNEWKKISKQKRPAVEWLLDIIFDEYGKNIGTNEKKQITKELVGYLSVIGDPLEFEHYKKAIAARVGVTNRIIDEIIVRFKSKSKNKKVESTTRKPYKNVSEEKYLLGLVLIHPRFIQLFVENLTDNDLLDDDVRSVYKVISDCYNEVDKKTLTDDDLKIISGCIEKKLPKDLQERVKFFVMEVEKKMKEIDDDEADQVFSDYMARIKGQSNKKVKEEFAQLISHAEEKKDIGEVKKLLEKFQEKISKK